MRALRLFGVLVALLAATTLSVRTAGSVPNVSKAEDVGFSTERLQRVHEAVARHIEAKDVSGAVTLVARRGKIVEFEAQGLADIESKKPMMKDSIFRLASMSKPITAVAVMMMVEEGKIRLTDRVSAFIPEFKNMKVAVAKGTTNPVQMPAFGRGGPPAPPPEFDLVPAAREITVKDLLTHTSGLMSGGVSGAEQAKLAPRSPNDTLANYIPKLAQTPLDFQPGTLWRYSGLYGFDVLARIVEIASGQPYDQFLKQRLFDPLGMKDTGLRADAGADGASRDRLPADAQRPRAGAERQPADQRHVFLRLRRPDEHGRRLPAVRPDARQRRPAERQAVPGPEDRRVDDGEPHRRHGERPVRPPRARDGLRASACRSCSTRWPPICACRPARYGWAGAYGTNQNMDPKEKMVSIIMMQGASGPLQRDFENAVWQAMIE